MLVLATSCVPMRDRREAARATWFSQLECEKWFVVGGQCDEPDVLGLPCGDGYADLPHKTVELCRYFLNTNHDWLFKCDDDTWINHHILKAMPLTGDYVGVSFPRSRYRPQHKNHIEKTPYVCPYAMGGVGYFLSRRAAAKILESPWQNYTFEDKMVGDALAKWLKEHNYPLTRHPEVAPAAVERGIMTAADSRFVPGVKYLAQTADMPITCVNLGMSVLEQHELQMLGVTVIPKPATPAMPGDVPAYRARIWEKPWYIEAAPYRYVYWIDADAVILKSLDGFVCNDLKVIVSTHGGPKENCNSPELYRKLRVPIRPTDTVINAGVLLYDQVGGRPIMDAWQWCIREALQSKAVRSWIKWQDQGALLWALHKLNRLDCVSNEVTYNQAACPWGGTLKQYPAKDTLTHVRADFPDSHIVHWVGNTKLWELALL